MTANRAGLWLVWALVLANPAQAAGPASAAKSYEQAARELDALDRRLLARERSMAALAGEALQARRQQAYAESMRSLTAMRLARAEKKLRRRLGMLLRQGGQSRAPLLIGQQSLAEAVDRERLLRTIASHDARLFAEVKHAHLVVDTEWREQRRAGLKLAAAHKALRQERGALALERRRRHTALARIAHKKPPAGLAVARLEAAQQAVASAVASAYGAPPNGDIAAGLSTTTERPTPGTEADVAPSPRAGGDLPWPTEGQLKARFGERVDLQFGTVTRHTGIAIAAPHGAPVRSVAAGQVVYADWLTGFGRTVIVAHPGAMHSVHAHLSKMAVRPGQLLSAQSLLGEVGDTASVRGTLLYFEIRKNGQPTDPLALLGPRPQ